MIDENITFILFGYTSNKLLYGSGKKVLCICNECGKERLIQYRYYRNLCASCAQKGNKHSMFGKYHSEETKRKISEGNMGKHRTEETKRKLSKAQSGKHHSEETKHKMSNSRKGDKHPRWKGGKKLKNARRNAKRRNLFGFIPHNKPHKNFHGHHLDFENVIYIPKELHTSIYHSVIKNINMEIINNIACDWYLKYQTT